MCNHTWPYKIGSTKEADITAFSLAFFPILSWSGLKIPATSHGPQDYLISISNSLLFLNHAVSVSGNDMFIELNFSVMHSVTAFVLAKQEEWTFLTIAAFISVKAAVLVANQIRKMCQIGRLNFLQQFTHQITGVILLF